jgi:hypothetical protein
MQQIHESHAIILKMKKLTLRAMIKAKELFVKIQWHNDACSRQTQQLPCSRYTADASECDDSFYVST